MENSIGKKIRYFRLRGGLSQLDLELALGAAQGSISRIESGRVNPTKETIYSISEVLNLSERERVFLTLRSDIPLSQIEIDEAVSSVKKYYDSPHVYGYLLDETYRFWYISQGFERLFRHFIPKEEADQLKSNLIGRSAMRAMVDPSLGLTRFFPEGKQYEEILYHQFSNNYYERSYMIDFDPTVKEDFVLLESFPVARKALRRVMSEPANINTLPAKLITLMFKGIKVNLYYSRQTLTKHPRFQTIEYVPSNTLLKLLAKHV